MDSRNDPPDRGPSEMDALVDADLARNVKIKAVTGDLSNLHLREVKHGIDAIIDMPDYIKRIENSKTIMVKTLNSGQTKKLLETTVFENIPVVAYTPASWNTAQGLIRSSGVDKRRVSSHAA